jgi:hypothetical protein
MKYTSLLIVLFALTLGSCEKEQNRRLLKAYVNFKVDGVPVHLMDGEGVNENTFECLTRGDTALIINASKVYQGIGFHIKVDNIKNGTYRVDSINNAYYSNPVDYKRYNTNSKSTGSITIRKGIFEGKSIINILEGEFEFIGEDTLTRKKFNITEGSFKMERQIY